MLVAARRYGRGMLGCSTCLTAIMVAKITIAGKVVKQKLLMPSPGRSFSKPEATFGKPHT